VIFNQNTPQCTQLKAILCRTSTKKELRNAYYKITPNFLCEYQCTSGKFIRLPNRIEKIDSVARIESKLFCPNWNALVVRPKMLGGGKRKDGSFSWISGNRVTARRRAIRRLAMQRVHCQQRDVVLQWIWNVAIYIGWHCDIDVILFHIYAA